MAITFRIVPERGLVVVKFEGVATVAELKAASAAYMVHPDYVAGQKQLVDLTHVTELERDYVGFMALQAAKAERLEGAGIQSLAAYIAPTPEAQKVATLFTRTWHTTENVVAMVQASEAEALYLLGQRETSIEALFQATGHPSLRQDIQS